MSLILTLDQSGNPHRWSTWQDAVTYQAKDLVSWSTGEIEFVFHGGKNRKTGEQSVIVVPSIIAVKSKVTQKYKTPVLSNKNLFVRDPCCSYCFSTINLTRDHVIPTSRGGKDDWMNCVAACKKCNNRKGDSPLEETDMDLIWAPYIPSNNEGMIMKNRNILYDQAKFLVDFLPNSRIRKDIISSYDLD